MVNDKGIVSCLEVQTGKQKWKHRIGGAFSASPVYSQTGIILLDEEGKGYVVQADPDRFQSVATNQLDAGCMASPAIIGNSLIIRTKKSLYRIDQ